MTKKILSIVLAAVMLVSLCTVAVFVTSAEEVDPNEVKLEDGREIVSAACAEAGIGTKRYYFYMPEDWFNDLTQTAGIYWWDSTGAPKAWPGYYAYPTAFEGIFYADVPADASTIIWNNGVNGGTDETKDVYFKAFQTKNIGSEYYDPGENDLYPDGVLEGFHGMIFVVDPNGEHETNDMSTKVGYAGDWFYYYGDGTCGTMPKKNEAADKYFQVLSTTSSGEEEATKEEPKPSTGDQKPTTTVKPTDAQSSMGKNNSVVKTGDAVVAAVIMLLVVMGTIGAGYVVSKKREQ